MMVPAIKGWLRFIGQPFCQKAGCAALYLMNGAQLTERESLGIVRHEKYIEILGIERKTG